MGVSLRSIGREAKWEGPDMVRVWRGETNSVAVGTMGADGGGCSGLGELLATRSG